MSSPSPIATILPRRTRLGWLGPVIVLVGAAVASIGIWYMVHARPVAGAVIDRFPIDERSALVVRGEAAGGERAFVELHDGDRLVWQAMVPRYAGTPGHQAISWSENAVSVRVIRDGHAEVFALAVRDGSKLGGIRLAPDRGPVVCEPGSPITLTDHLRSYEIVSGPGWHQLIAIDLGTGKALWTRDLGTASIRGGGVAGRTVWIDQGKGRQCFAGLTGAPDTAAGSAGCGT
jgi:hypothetical protein